MKKLFLISMILLSARSAFGAASQLTGKPLAEERLKTLTDEYAPFASGTNFQAGENALAVFLWTQIIYLKGYLNKPELLERPLTTEDLKDLEQIVKEKSITPELTELKTKIKYLPIGREGLQVSKNERKK